MGRNSPMNDFCALGLSAPISVSELVGLWGGWPPHILGNGVHSHRAKVRASLVARVHQGALGPWIDHCIVVKDDFPEEMMLDSGMDEIIVNQVENVKWRNSACLLGLRIKMI